MWILNAMCREKDVVFELKEFIILSMLLREKYKSELRACPDCL